MSRATSDPFHGKRTAVVKAAVSEALKEDFTAFWKARGFSSESDCVNELIAVALYGVDTLANVHRQRIESLFQKAASFGQGGGQK